jgi:hypothetical protein
MNAPNKTTCLCLLRWRCGRRSHTGSTATASCARWRHPTLRLAMMRLVSTPILHLRAFGPCERLVVIRLRVTNDWYETVSAGVAAIVAPAVRILDMVYATRITLEVSRDHPHLFVASHRQDGCCTIH